MMTAAMTTKHNKESGFTLIELLIVIVIVGVLAAIAVPSYSSHMENTRRLDAKVFLQEVAGEQVRFFSDNNVFAKSMDELGYGANPSYESPDGHYSITISNDVDTSFTLTASPVATSPQINDTQCIDFSLDSTGLKGVSGPAGVEGCW